MMRLPMFFLEVAVHKNIPVKRFGFRISIFKFRHKQSARTEHSAHEPCSGAAHTMQEDKGTVEEWIFQKVAVFHYVYE